MKYVYSLTIIQDGDMIEMGLFSTLENAQRRACDLMSGAALWVASLSGYSWRGRVGDEVALIERCTIDPVGGRVDVA